MHFEILVEDKSGKKLLEAILPRILDSEHTYNIFPYKGIGHIPKNMKDAADSSKRILLANLPRLLKGFGKTFEGYGQSYQAAVVVVCDLDSRDKNSFLGELDAILAQCNPPPRTAFCLAIEEGEAWLLGDLRAVLAAYPKAVKAILESYKNDSICGTWEILADAIYPGGRKALVRNGWQAVGKEKSIWAESISRHMDVESNKSPSFCSFRDSMRNF